MYHILLLGEIMKKILILLIMCLSILIYPAHTNNVYAINTVETQNNIKIKSPSAFLIEYSTGEIIFEKNSEKTMYPASMTKMMAMYLFMECIEKKTHSLEDIVQVSTLASSMGGSQIFLKEYEKMSFNDLFKAVTIASANDAVVALAEHTYSSIDNFVNEMNLKAKEFNMNNTNFVNATGFHDPNHYTTAKDMGILAQKLVKDYGDIILKYTSTYDTYLREDTSSPFWLVNTNKMIKYYQGMDGLKTGYTSDSGFNLTATAKRNNLRFISVIMGAESSKQRNADTSTLLDYAFSNYKLVTLYKSGEVISTYTFNNAKEANTPIVSKENVTYLMHKNDKLEDINVKIIIETYNAPISKENKIGLVMITNPNTKNEYSFDLYTQVNVERLSFKDIFINYLRILL